MSSDFPESDWKVLRQLHPVALDRYCRRVLSEIERLSSDPEKTGHQCYLAVFECVQRRDRELADAFNNPSRSKAFLKLIDLWSLGLLTDEELARFTPETLERFHRLGPVRRA